MNQHDIAKELFSSYSSYQREDLSPVNCKHGTLQKELLSLKNQGRVFQVSSLGCSIEGRDISLVTCGGGVTPVLLWSQMHGDESTATLALMDIFSLLRREHEKRDWIQEILSRLTLLFIPMLNPDGAERAQRRTATGIDMNRDALALVTPEARILHDVQQKYSASFGFNLHDQELSSVGQTTDVTAIALLAPAPDQARTTPPVRERAIKVADGIAKTLAEFVDGHIATYDDTFEPRAFGDNMQKWGTSTVLIESGHWYDDREKQQIRKLNVAAILSALHGIASGEYESFNGDAYRALQPNGKQVYDIIVRNALGVFPTGWKNKVDIGLNYETNKHSDKLTLKDIGDLSTFGALKSIDAQSIRIQLDKLSVDTQVLLEDIVPSSP